MYPPARTWEMLRESISDGRGELAGPLFCRIHKGGVVTTERLTDQSVYYIMKRLIGLTGVENFSPHDLRGSFISYLLDNGEDIKTVAAIVGHADVRTTASYDRRGEERKNLQIGRSTSEYGACSSLLKTKANSDDRACRHPRDS